MSRFLSGADFSRALNGSPKYLGTIVAGTSAKTNANTTVPFTIPAGAMLLIEADADVLWLPGSNITVASGKSLAAKGEWAFALKSSVSTVAAITSTGSANLKVFQLE